MTSLSPSSAKQEAKRWANNEWAQRFARLGYASKGLVYIVIGVLATQAAMGAGGATTDREGALQTIAQQSFGQTLLILTTIGILSYALWNFARALLNLEDHDSDAKGMLKRVAYVVIGSSYSLLAWTALQIVLNRNSDGQNTQDWTAKVLGWPIGQWLIIAAGLVFVAVAGYEAYKAYSTDFTQKLDLHTLEQGARSAVMWIGRAGLAARTIVFALLGYFLIQAALQHDPSEARGLGGALQSLTQQTYGPWLLLLVAVGVIMYGIYSFVVARYRRLGTNTAS